MKKGLSAFPLTPLRAGEVDENTWLSLIENIAGAGVDSIGVLGSTGSYAYLTREQRLRVTRLRLRRHLISPLLPALAAYESKKFCILWMMRSRRVSVAF